jgi:hypothetical protein
VLLASFASHANESKVVNVLHFEELQALTFERAEESAVQGLSTADTATLTFNALGRNFELELEPNEHVISGIALGAMSSDIEIYSGRIAGNPDSWVRVVMHNGDPRGLIWDGTDLLAIEAPGDSAVATTVPVVFRLADTLVTAGALGCSAVIPSSNGATSYSALVGELGASVAEASDATMRLNLSAIGDFDFVTSISGDPEVAIATRLNNVDG